MEQKRNKFTIKMTNNNISTAPPNVNIITRTKGGPPHSVMIGTSGRLRNGNVHTLPLLPPHQPTTMTTNIKISISTKKSNQFQPGRTTTPHPRSSVHFGTKPRVTEFGKKQLQTMLAKAQAPMLQPESWWTQSSHHHSEQPPSSHLTHIQKKRVVRTTKAGYPSYYETNESVRTTKTGPHAYGKYSPGTYVVVCKGGVNVMEGFSWRSKRIGRIQYNTQIEIATAQTNTAEGNILGQLLDGNWVTIERLHDGYNWIIPYNNKHLVRTTKKNGPPPSSTKFDRIPSEKKPSVRPSKSNLSHLLFGKSKERSTKSNPSQLSGKNPKARRPKQRPDAINQAVKEMNEVEHQNFDADALHNDVSISEIQVDNAPDSQKSFINSDYS